MIDLTINEFIKGDEVVFSDKKIKIENIKNNKYTIVLDGKKKKLTKTKLFNLLCQLEDEKPSVFTHNCQFRIICGRIGSIASLMALGSTVATTISGKKPGAGMISSNGIVENIQHYFAKHDYIKSWYEKRGLNEKGYENGSEQIAENYEELSGEELLEFQHDVTTIDFSGVHGEVNKTPDQEFKEI